MTRCKLLLPPLTLGEETITEVGAIVDLGKTDAKNLSAVGVVEVLDESEEVSEPERVIPTEEELIRLQNADPSATEEEMVSASLTEEQVPPSKLNLNTATEEELVALPYLGKAIAQKLIKARPIDSLDKAKSLTGLSPEKWSELEEKLTV